MLIGRMNLRSITVVLASLLFGGSVLIVDGSSHPAAAAGSWGADRSFGSSGLASLPYLESVDAVAHDASNRLLAVGRGTSPGDDLAVTRLLPDGSLDEGFGESGMVSFAVPNDAWPEGVSSPDGRFRPQAIAVAADGGVLVGGVLPSFPDWERLAFVRLHPTGALDTDYGDGGVSRPLGEGYYDLARLQVQRDGALVAVGTRFSDPGSEGLVVRLLPSGDLDARFHGDGIATFSRDGGDFPYTRLDDGVLEGDGSLVLAGGGLNDLDGDGEYETASSLLFRVTAVGLPDGDFGTSGHLELPVDLGETVSVGLAPSGSITAAGTVDDTLLAVRITKQGSVDQTFGDAGQVVVHGVTGQAFVLAPGASDVLVAASSTSGGTQIVRFDRRGRLVGDVDAGGPPPVDALLERSGRVIVAGSSPPAMFAVVQQHPRR